MRREMQVSDSVLIAADARTIYDQVADPTQMRRWSRENTGATTPSPGRPLVAGESFTGTNRRGRAAWATRCVVTAAEPGRLFAFDVRRIGVRTPGLPARIASWRYTFAECEGGTLVTETWLDGRTGWPDWLTDRFDRLATGGWAFHEFQQRNIADTLRAMKADFEGACV